METIVRNRVQLMGNLGRDPEMKEFEGGKRRVSFSLATNERFEYGQGQAKEDVQWHQVVAWGRTADQVQKESLKKGSRVALEGRLVHRSYEKDGQKRYFTEVVMNQFQLLESAPQALEGSVATI